MKKLSSIATLPATGTAVKGGRRAGPARRWTILTNHGSVLLHLAQRPDDTIRSIAAALGLTERTTAAIIADLRQAGYIQVQRRGRHNHYIVNSHMPLRRPAHSKLSVGNLIETLAVL